MAFLPNIDYWVEIRSSYDIQCSKINAECKRIKMLCSGQMKLENGFNNTMEEQKKTKLSFLDNLAFFWNHSIDVSYWTESRN